MTAPAPAVPPTAAPTPPKQSNGIGLAALIVAIVAFVFAVVPVLSFIAWLPAVVAIGLGIAGLVVKNRKRTTSAVALGVAVLAWIVAIVVSVVTATGLAASVSESIESAAPEIVATEEAVAEEEVVAEEPVEPAEPEAPAVPADFASALIQAGTYAEMMHMSKAGIYDQLVSEYGGQFTPEAAQYAVDNVVADWNANALAQAKTYQETMAMSPEAIRDQLASEYGGKFTPEEADYAVQNLNG